jgi:endonuclease G
MVSVEDINARRDALKKGCLERWQQWGKQREERLRKVEAKGIFEAAGATSAARRMAHTTVAEGRTFEALVGGDDTDHINFLSHGWRAGRSVCRIVFGNTAIGSGFLVAPGVILTNNHVAADAQEAASFAAEFDFERDVNGTPMTPHRFALDPGRLFVTSPQERLDFTLVALNPRSRTAPILPPMAGCPSTSVSTRSSRASLW